MDKVEISVYLKRYIKNEYYPGKELKIDLDPNAFNKAKLIFDTWGSLEITDKVMDTKNLPSEAYKIAKITIDNKTEILYGRMHAKR